MFYPVRYQEELPRPQAMALVCLTSAEAKRLIAKGVAALPEVRDALERGIVVIARGTTNAYVAEEILGSRIEPKAHYAAGFIADGELSANAPQTRMRPITLKQGKPANLSPEEALKEFREGDVFIKGANAVDPEGNAGVLAAGDTGGTIGAALPVLTPRGCLLVVPVGLEKLIPSVAQAARSSGIFRFKYSTGLPVGLVPMANALVVSEVQALGVLTGVRACPVAGGGIGGSEGSTVLSLMGTEEQVERAFSLVRQVKGEPALSKPVAQTNPPAATFGYDAQALWHTLHPQPRP